MTSGYSSLVVHWECLFPKPAYCTDFWFLISLGCMPARVLKLSSSQDCQCVHLSSFLGLPFTFTLWRIGPISPSYIAPLTTQLLQVSVVPRFLLFC